MESILCCFFFILKGLCVYLTELFVPFCILLTKFIYADLETAILDNKQTNKKNRIVQCYDQDISIYHSAKLHVCFINMHISTSGRMVQFGKHGRDANGQFSECTGSLQHFRG